MKIRNALLIGLLSFGAQAFGDQESPIIKLDRIRLPREIEGMDPFLVAVKRAKLEEVEQFLQDDGSLANAIVEIGDLGKISVINFAVNSATHMLSFKNKLALLKLFLKYGADQNVVFKPQRIDWVYGLAGTLLENIIAAQSDYFYYGSPEEKKEAKEYLAEAIPLLLKAGAQFSQGFDENANEAILTNDAGYFLARLMQKRKNPDIFVMQSLADHLDVTKQYGGNTLIDWAKSNLSKLNAGLELAKRIAGENHSENDPVMINYWNPKIQNAQAIVDYLESRTPKAKK